MGQEQGRLLVTNVTQTVVNNGVPVRFRYPVPPGGLARIKSATFKLVPDSNHIRLRNWRITPVGASRGIALMNDPDAGNTQGVPNIKEFAGRGGKQRIFPVVETSDQNQNMEIEVFNTDPVSNVRVSLTFYWNLIETELVTSETPGPVPTAPKFESQLLVFNRFISIPGNGEANFVFTMPSGAHGKVRETTFFLPVASSDVIVKSIKLIRPGESQETELLDQGTPNIDEIAGDGEFSRVWEVLESVNQGDDLIVKLRKDSPGDIDVSFTVWFEMVAAKRLLPLGDRDEAALAQRRL